MQKVAIYPGSFDPITNGHISIIKRALKVVDKLIVVVAENSEKNPLFKIEERVKLIADLGIENTHVKSFKGLLVDCAKQENVNIVIRGLRAVSDFDYEFQLALANRRMNRELETVFLMTDYKYSYLSSSMLKDMAKYGGNIEGLVPENVKNKLKERFLSYGDN